MLHHLFIDKRVRGEWFEFGDTDPVGAISKALERSPLPISKPRKRAIGPRGRRDVNLLPDGPRPGRRGLQIYRSPAGGVIVQRECMSTCYGDMFIWKPGQHTHAMSMSAEQYEEFGPDGPPLGKATAPRWALTHLSSVLASAAGASAATRGAARTKSARGGSGPTKVVRERLI